MRAVELLGDPREAVQPVLAGGAVGGRALAVEREQLRGGQLAGRDLAGGLGAAEREHRAHACGLGTRKPSSVASGACASATSRGRHACGSSSRSRPVTSTTCEVGRDAVEVELADLRDVADDRRELARHRLDLLLAQREARQAGDVQDLVAVDHGCAV